MKDGQEALGRGWSAAGMVMASLAAIGTWDYLAVGVAPGVGAALLLLLGLGLVVARWRSRLRGAGLFRGWPLAAAACVIVSAAALLWRGSALALGLGLTALLTLALAGRLGDPRGMMGWMARVLLVPPALVAGAWADRRITARWAAPRQGRRPPARSLAPTWRAWRPAIAAALAFMAIFSFANPIFAHGVREVLREILPETWPTVPRILTWTAFGLGTWLLLRGHLPSRQRRALESVDPERALVTTSAGKVLRLLLAVNAVFAMQAFIDARYLWAGATLPRSVTYSDFARHGAFLLMVAVLVSAAITLLLFGPHSVPSGDRACRLLGIAWLAQNAFIVVSAAERLHLYVNAYGLTLARLAAATWMLLVLIGVVLTAWKVSARKSHAWQLNANGLAAVLVLLSVCFVDARGSVAWFNVQHPPQSEFGIPRDPDLEYLASLGPAALPALHWWRATTPGRTARQSGIDLEWRLRRELAVALSSWQGWSLDRARLWAFAIRPT